MTAIVWFRRDLRLHDNPVLQAALADHEQVIPAFCLDERLIQGRASSDRRTAFMLGCLSELADDLKAAGSGLVVLQGPPHKALPELAASCRAAVVFAASDVSPFARKRDQAVGKALERHDTKLVLGPGLFAVEDVDEVRTEAGSPYSVFTPFYNRWQHARRRTPAGTVSSLPPLPAGLATAPPPTADELKLSDFELPAQGSAGELSWSPGERAARAAVDLVLDERVDGYADAHDLMALDGTSQLSPYLHFGCISPRELEARLGESDGAQALRRQLCWRDFYAQVLLTNPHNAQVEHQARYRRTIKWENHRAEVDAWREGRTGYPIVDAAMRQLMQTGWMHNRTRMVVGSFLVKDLGVDWRWGERWFMRMLLDGDEANNNGNWQWIASVGVDTQPVSRRIYSPMRQQERFDPEGVYVRRYVPELRPVPDRYLTEPWTMPIELQHEVGCRIGADYPAPIVDHQQARRAALARYEQAAQ